MKNQTLFVFSSFLLLLLLSPTYAKLTKNFYKNSCPNVESIVESAVSKKFKQTFVTASATLRLFFHDCFVRGCDASVLIASPKGNVERDHPDDISLASDGFDTVIKAKAAVEAQCLKTVSCADILALATRDVVKLAGGPSYSVELGRRDGRISTKSSVENSLPHADFNVDKLNTTFSKNGLSLTDVVALSGAHSIGFSHCGQVSKRIYNFSTISKVDPTLNKAYAKQLQGMCPQKGDPRIAINMDPTTPGKFDNVYYKNLQQGKGLFTSDQTLFTDLRTRKIVNTFASNSSRFNQAFVNAMTRLGRLGVLTGTQGEIRLDCTRPN